MRTYLPYLIDESGKSLTTDGISVQPAVFPTELPETPDGWEDNSISFERNKEFRGLIRSYTTGLKFYRDGARIIREYFYKKSREAKLYFIWLKLDKTFGGQLKYRSWYKGQVSIPSVVDGAGGVQVNIEEGGFSRELQSNKTVVQEIKPTHSVVMDGMMLQFNFTYSTLEDEILHDNASPGGSGSKTTRELISFPFISSETGVAQLEATSQMREVITSLSTNINTFLVNPGTDPVTMDVKVSIPFTYFITRFSITGAINPHNVQVKLDIVDSTMTVKQNLFTKTYTDSSNTQSGNEAVSMDISLTINPGEKLYLLLTTVQTYGAAITLKFGEAYTKFSYNYTFKQTVIRGIPAVDLGDALCKAMSNGKSGMDAAELPNMETLVITSGDLLRGLPGVIKTTFSNYHSAMDAVNCVSFTIEDEKGLMQPRQAAFKNTEIADLGEVIECEVKPANEYVYDEIEVGYPTQDIEGVNGKLQFNNTVLYKTPDNTGKNKYDAKSPYYADPYAIELTRLNLEGKNSTDSKSDNDNFILDCELNGNSYNGELMFERVLLPFGGIYMNFLSIPAIGTGILQGMLIRVTGTADNDGVFNVGSIIETNGRTLMVVTEDVVNETIIADIDFSYYTLRRLPYQTITGIPANNNVFNLELSPKRILKRHYSWIRSGLYQMDREKIIWKSADRNSDVVTTDMQGNVIKEKEDILIGTMGERMFLPFTFSFDCRYSQSLLEVMDTGYFTFKDGGNEYRIYPESVKVNDNDMDVQEFSGISHFNNDMSKRV